MLTCLLGVVIGYALGWWMHHPTPADAALEREVDADLRALHERLRGMRDLRADQ